jgi:ribosomal protein L20A (L18A)
MLKIYRVALLIPFLLTGACTSEENQSTPAQPDKNHIFKDQVQALEKAKAVEKALQDAAAKRRKMIEQQTQ